MRAGPLNVAVRQEPLALRAVCLVDDLLIDIAVLFQFGHDCPGPVMRCRVVGHPETVEDHPHTFEGLIKMFVISFRERPRGDAGFLGGDHDRCPVVV